MYKGATTTRFKWCASSVMSNPSLNHRTPKGGLSWPSLGCEVHFPSLGQAIPP